jgi:hypothetical protein
MMDFHSDAGGIELRGKRPGEIAGHGASLPEICKWSTTGLPRLRWKFC